MSSYYFIKKTACNKKWVSISESLDCKLEIHEKFATAWSQTAG